VGALLIGPFGWPGEVEDNLRFGNRATVRKAGRDDEAQQKT
jgi:hypothetical protein